MPRIHTLIIHRSQDAYNYIWKIFPGIDYGTRNSSEVMPARKRVLCRIIFENSGKVAVVVVFDFCRNTADGKIRQHQLLSKKRIILKRQTENRLPPFISECHTQHPFRSKKIVSLDLPPKFHPSELQFRLHNFCRHIIPALL